MDEKSILCVVSLNGSLEQRHSRCIAYALVTDAIACDLHVIHLITQRSKIYPDVGPRTIVLPTSG